MPLNQPNILPFSNTNLRHRVFWPPFLLLAVTVVVSLFYKTSFLENIKGLNQWILTHFDGLFSWATFGCLLLVAGVYFSPLARVRIGGPEAVPLLSKWRWFSVTLCTTIATGILFWGCAEQIGRAHV